MRKYVTVIALIALGVVVPIVLRAAARVRPPRLVAGFGAEFTHGFVLTAIQAPEAPGSGHGYLIDKHLAAGLQCASCHTENPPAKQPSMATCLSCHGGS